MDFIIKLLTSIDPVNDIAFDAIIVVIDKLSKYSILVPFKELYNTEQLGFVLLDRLIRDYSIPRIITSDRDKLFILKYWKTLIANIGTKLKLSTAYYPETNR